jgi:hypothetical protein
MAKKVTKKTTASKKPTASKKSQVSKKPAVSRKKPSASAKRAASAKSAVSTKSATSAKSQAVVPAAQVYSGAHEKNIALLPPEQMNGIKLNIDNEMQQFKSFADNYLTPLQRRRKIGPGTRNYGFIDKVSDLAAANPNYAHFFNIDDLKNCVRNIEICREIVILLQAFARLVTNTMMIYSDDAYSMALNYYNMVKEMSKQGDPEAIELYRDLKTYFKRSKHSSAEPTERELERDIHSLIHGTKDGEVIIKSKSPKMTGGMRKIVDDVHKNRAGFKESENGEIED